MKTSTMAMMLILMIEDLKLQERCKNYNDTWENTKEVFLKEAEKGENNFIFWLAVENIAKAIKKFTR